MTFKDMPPGRYDCRITDWALEQVAQLNNALKVIIQLAITVPSETGTIAGRWEGLVETKDGKPNQKTIKTLLSGGFASDDIYTLGTSGSALDTQKPMEATVIKNEKGYTTVEWLNSAGGSGLQKGKVTGRTSPALKAALASALKEKGIKKSVKNYAPGASAQNDNSDLGF